MRKVIIFVMALIPIFVAAQSVRKNAINLNAGGTTAGVGLNYERLVASGKHVQLFVNGGFKKQNWSEEIIHNQYDNSWAIFTLIDFFSCNESNSFFSTKNSFEKGTLMNENIKHRVNTFTLGSNVVLAKYLEFGLSYRLDRWNRDITQTLHNAPSIHSNNTVSKHYIIPSMSIRYQTKNGLLLKTGIAKGVESNKISKSLIAQFSMGYAF